MTCFTLTVDVPRDRADDPFGAIAAPAALRAHKAVCVKFSGDPDPGGRQGMAMLDLLRWLRRHPDPCISLKPLFVIIEPGAQIGSYAEAITDGVARGESPEAVCQRHGDLIQAISARMQTLRIPEAPIAHNAAIAHDATAAQGGPIPQHGPAIQDAPISNDTSPERWTLRYLFTRKISLKPIPWPASHLGYIYPLADLHFPGNGAAQFDLIASMADRLLIRGVFQDKIHRCPDCGSGFLNFREICETCRSPNLATEELIRHLACGHVAPASAWASERGRICPGCGKPPGRAGRDHDRPGAIHACRACGHAARDTRVDVICLKCGRAGGPEDLTRHILKAYTITGAGDREARSTRADRPAFPGPDQKTGGSILADAPFRFLLAMEAERIRRYGVSDSALGVLHLEDFSLRNLRGDAPIDAVMAEIAEAAARVTRFCDLICHAVPDRLMFLLTDTPPERAQLVLKRLERLATDHLRDRWEAEGVFRTACFSLADNVDGAELFLEAAGLE